MHRIDAQIAIAEAFDSAQLGKRASSTEIASATGIGVKRISRLTRGINIALVKKRTPCHDTIPTRYSPPVHGLKADSPRSTECLGQSQRP